MTIEFDTEEMVDSAINSIKEALGSWDMNVVCTSAEKDGYRVRVSTEVADGKVDATTFKYGVELDFEIHTCESSDKATRWLIYVDSVDVIIKDGSTMVDEEHFDIDDVKMIADFIKKHLRGKYD